MNVDLTRRDRCRCLQCVWGDATELSSRPHAWCRGQGPGAARGGRFKSDLDSDWEGGFEREPKACAEEVSGPL
jgi:hypothetical protein